MMKLYKLSITITAIVMRTPKHKQHVLLMAFSLKTLDMLLDWYHSPQCVELDCSMTP